MCFLEFDITQTGLKSWSSTTQAGRPLIPQAGFQSSHGQTHDSCHANFRRSIGEHHDYVADSIVPLPKVTTTELRTMRRPASSLDNYCKCSHGNSPDQVGLQRLCVIVCPLKRDGYNDDASQYVMDMWLSDRSKKPLLSRRGYLPTEHTSPATTSLASRTRSKWRTNPVP